MLFEGLMSSLGILSERKRCQERLRTLKDLDKAALALREVARVVLDEAVSDGEVRKAVLERMDRDALTRWVSQVGELAIAPEHQLSASWKHALNAVGRFSVPLVKAIAFEGTPGAQPLLAALRFLTLEEGSRRRSWRRAPKDFIARGREDAVYPHGGEPDKATYLLCAAQRLWTALKGREVFVSRSLRYSDARGQLLSLKAWKNRKDDVCRSLQLDPQASVFLERLGQDLATLYGTVLERLPEYAEVRLEEQAGKTSLRLKALEKQPESESLRRLDQEYAARLHSIDLPELLLELHAHTGFVDE